MLGFGYTGGIQTQTVADGSSPWSRVTLHLSQTSALAAIIDIGKVSHQPLGIVLGANASAFCASQQKVDIEDESALDAVARVVKPLKYSVATKQGVVVVEPDAIAQWLTAILEHRYDFPALTGLTITSLGTRLDGWMKMEVGHAPGYAASTHHAPNAQRFDLGAMMSASTEEIADRIVSLGPKAVWMMGPNTPNPKSALDMDIRVAPYDDPDALGSLNCGP
jgi:hypothetical protein